MDTGGKVGHTRDLHTSQIHLLREWVPEATGRGGKDTTFPLVFLTVSDITSTSHRKQYTSPNLLH